MALRRLFAKASIFSPAASTILTPPTLATMDLRSLLCKEQSCWHPLWSRISFHEDGTGELFLGVEYSRFIAAKFTWEPCDGLLDFVLHLDNPAILGQFKLRMTLLKHCPLPDASTNRYHINEALLADTAFLPKTFTRFLSPYEALGEGKAIPITRPYALQLSFDPSPYPPESEWIGDEGTSGCKVNRVWEWTDFCAYQFRKERGT